MTSEWHGIPGFPAYEAHPDGYVRSISRMVKGRDASERFIAGRELVPTVRPNGVPAVNLWRDNTCRQIPLRELILAAFGHQPGLQAVNVNGDLADNRISNLRWQKESND